jgi:hypothetical protein
MIPPEIVAVEKEKDAAAGLIADAGALSLVGGAGQQQGCAPAARRGDEHPPLVALKRGVLDQFEA